MRWDAKSVTVKKSNPFEQIVTKQESKKTKFWCNVDK